MNATTLPAPTATSPSGFSAMWEGEGWSIKVIPNNGGGLQLLASPPQMMVADFFEATSTVNVTASRAYALALLAALDHIEKNPMA